MSIIDTWNGLLVGAEYPVGTIIAYNGAQIGGGDTADITTRTDKISTDNGDGIDFGQGDWYVANGDGDGGAVPDLINLFIRGEATSANEDGNDNAVNPVHSHEGGSTSSGNHSHTISAGGAHTHNSRLTTSYICLYLSGGSWFWIGNYQDQLGNRNTSTGGAHTHTISSEDSHTHGGTTESTGVAGTNLNKPAYYEVIWVIKMA